MFLRFLLQSRLYSTIYDAQAEIVYRVGMDATLPLKKTLRKKKAGNWSIQRFSLNPRNITFGILISLLNIFQKKIAIIIMIYILCICKQRFLREKKRYVGGGMRDMVGTYTICFFRRFHWFYYIITEEKPLYVQNKQNKTL